MQITIASIQLKEKRSTVLTTDGRTLGVWTDKLGAFGLEQGSSYEVETEARDFNGRTLTNIVQAKRLAAGTVVSSQPATERISNGNGVSKDREIFTVALLKSSIESGQLKYNDKQGLWEAGQTFMALHKHLFAQDMLVATNSGVKRVA